MKSSLACVSHGQSPITLIRQGSLPATPAFSWGVFLRPLAARVYFLQEANVWVQIIKYSDLLRGTLKSRLSFIPSFTASRVT